MTPEAFQSWLAAMKAAGLIRSDAAAARLLDVSQETIMAWKRDGARRVVDLACEALEARLALIGPAPSSPASRRADYHREYQRRRRAAAREA